MRTAFVSLIVLLAACGGQQLPTQQPSGTLARSAEVTKSPSLTPTAAVTPRPTTIVTPRPTTIVTPRPTAVVAEGVAALAREHCPDKVREWYETCVEYWVSSVFGLPTIRFVLCVWPDGRFQIDEPGFEGAGSEIGDECHNIVTGDRGTVTWIVNEGR